MVAFGYRLPQKSYAIFHLPRPAQAAGSARVGQDGRWSAAGSYNKDRGSENRNRARKLPIFENHPRDKKEVSGKNLAAESGTGNAVPTEKMNPESSGPVNKDEKPEPEPEPSTILHLEPFSTKNSSTKSNTFLPTVPSKQVSAKKVRNNIKLIYT